ncbi:MAG: hypothetical protein ACYDAO_00120 [Thermoplasmataceae archaeon]
MGFINQSVDYPSDVRGVSSSLLYSNQGSSTYQKHEKKPYKRKNVFENRFCTLTPATYPKGRFGTVPNLNSLENSHTPSTNIVDYTIETIIKARFASFNPKNLPEIKSYISKMQALYNYNPMNLLFLLRKTNNYLQEVIKNKKGTEIEVKYFLDEEDEKLNGISINVYLPVKDAEILSDIWDYLNRNVGLEENGADKIFFNVRKKM